MVVPVMSKNIKAGTTEHLLNIRWMIKTKNLRQFHQRVIIHARCTPIYLQQGCSGKHMNAPQMTIQHFFTVKTLHSKITATIPGRHDLTFRNDNSTIRSTVHVGFFHQSAVRMISLRRELDYPFRHHPLGTRTAAASTHPKQCIQIANILAIQCPLTGGGEFVQICNTAFAFNIPRWAVCQRAHSRCAHNSKPFHLRNSRRINATTL